MQPTQIQFRGEDGVQLGGWLYRPNVPHPAPAITMAHGFAATCAHGLDAFARVFAEAGFVVLMHDHRGFGSSEGEPRHDIDPWKQIADWRYAISFLDAHPAVDRNRIGLWGSSFAGGHALVLGATDRRLKAVVSQVPTISGYEQSRRRIAPEIVRSLEDKYLDDDRRRFVGGEPATQLVVTGDMRSPAVYRTADAHAFYVDSLPTGATWSNTVTVRSSRAARMYGPGQWVSRVSPTPLLMVIALDDTVTLTDTGLAAYEQALQPKSLAMIDGGHFDPYNLRFPHASSAALEWFRLHLADALGR